MFLFYVLSFFKKGDTIQGGSLFKGDNIQRNTVVILPENSINSQNMIKHFIKQNQGNI